MNNQHLTWMKVPETTTLRQRIRMIMEKINLWIKRYRSRQQLARLDDRMLSDIGLSRADVYAETDKPFWKD